MTTLDTYVQDLPQPDQGWTVKAGLWTAAAGLVMIFALAFISGGAADHAAANPGPVAAEIDEMLSAMQFH